MEIGLAGVPKNINGIQPAIDMHVNIMNISDFLVPFFNTSAAIIFPTTLEV